MDTPGLTPIRIRDPDIRVPSGYFFRQMSKNYSGLPKISGYPEYPDQFCNAKHGYP